MAPLVRPPPQLWTSVAGATLVAGAAGYGLRRHGQSLERRLEDVKAELGKTRDKERRDVLVADQDRIDTRSGVEMAAGTSLIAIAIALAAMVPLLGVFNVRPRRAAMLLAPALLFAAVYSVYMAGIVSMVVSGILALGLIWFLTGEPDPQRNRQIEEFRRFPTRREVAPEIASTAYRSVAEHALHIEQQKLLRAVTHLPPAFARMLPTVCEGHPVRYLQLLENLAYVAFVEADAYNVADYVTVLMLLQDPAHSFAAKPLPIVDGVRLPNTGITFKEDPQFSKAYLVEVDPGRDPRAVRAFLSPVVRDELLSLPAVWLHVNGTVMALTLFGRFDAETADHLVDMADVLFAEYGADGGPSLIDPDGAEVIGAPQTLKKKQKKKQPHSSAREAPGPRA